MLQALLEKILVASRLLEYDLGQGKVLRLDEFLI